MNYQYNQQPVDLAAVHAQRQARLFSLSDKLAEFFSGNPFTRIFVKGSDILTYIVLGIDFIISLLAIILSGSCPLFLVIVALFFGVLAIAKRQVIPLACVFSVIASAELGNFITTIVMMAKYRISGGALAIDIFALIFGIVELALVVVLCILLWMEVPFSFQYAPRMAAPAYGQPPMQGAAPMAGAPMQQPAPMAAPGVCPNCGVQNEPGAGFCKGCGTKL